MPFVRLFPEEKIHTQQAVYPPPPDPWFWLSEALSLLRLCGPIARDADRRAMLGGGPQLLEAIHRGSWP